MARRDIVMKHDFKKEIVRCLFYSIPSKKTKKIIESQFPCEIEYFVEMIMGGSIIPPDIDCLGYIFDKNDFKIIYLDFEDEHFHMRAARAPVSKATKIMKKLENLKWKEKYSKIYMNDNIDSQILVGFTTNFFTYFKKQFGKRQMNNFIQALNNSQFDLVKIKK